MISAVDFTREHARFAINFERWTEVCIRAGEHAEAERCRADAELHRRLAGELTEPRKEIA